MPVGGIVCRPVRVLGDDGGVDDGLCGDDDGAGGKSRAEIEKLLSKFKCTQFVVGSDSEKRQAMVQFKAQNRIIRFMVQLPDPADKKFTQHPRYSWERELMMDMSDHIPPRRITRGWLKRHRSNRGGWTKEQLAILGIVWPPPKGWLKAVVKSGRTMTFAQQKAFEQAVGLGRSFRDPTKGMVVKPPPQPALSAEQMREREAWELLDYWLECHVDRYQVGEFRWLARALVDVPAGLIRIFMDNAKAAGVTQDLRYVKGCVRQERSRHEMIHRPVEVPVDSTR